MTKIFKHEHTHQVIPMTNQKPELETQQYLQQFFEKDAQTIQTWFEAAIQAHPNPPFGYEGLKNNPGFLIITFGALQSFLEAGKTIEDYIAVQRTPTGTGGGKNG